MSIGAIDRASRGDVKASGMTMGSRARPHAGEISLGAEPRCTCRACATHSARGLRWGKRRRFPATQRARQAGSGRSPRGNRAEIAATGRARQSRAGRRARTDRAPWPRRPSSQKPGDHESVSNIEIEIARRDCRRARRRRRPLARALNRRRIGVGRRLSLSQLLRRAVQAFVEHARRGFAGRAVKRKVIPPEALAPGWSSGKAPAPESQGRA